MTRINCIPVEELTNKHLLAEYRELPRIFSLAKIVSDAPKHYVLGTGHMKFFYDKLEYLYLRQQQIINELKKRNYNVSFTAEGLKAYHKDFGGPLPACLWNDWQPTQEAMELNRARINERLAGIKYRKIA